jgi:RHS repeat-associated protein
MTNALNYTTQYGYDIRGHQTVITYTDGTTLLQGFNATGQIITSTDQAGKITTYNYYPNGHLYYVTNPLNQTTTYTYDGVGNLLTMTDANNHTITNTYDALNRLQQKTWANNTSFEIFSYDKVGNQTIYQLADGQLITTTYDIMSRPSQVTFFDGRIVTYTYTANGQTQTISDSVHGLTSYGYDNQDRVNSITQPGSQVISYTYDAANNRQNMTSPAGTITYTYDADNHLQSVTDPQNKQSIYHYDAMGNRQRLDLPNGLYVYYGYDTLNRLTNITQTKMLQNPVAAYTYTLGAAGNRTNVTEWDGSNTTTRHWDYDQAYRLISETITTITNTTQTGYTYDGTGNRKTMTVVGVGTTNYNYNNLDQLLTSGSVTYNYDSRGNRISQVDSSTGISLTYGYDAADRLTNISGTSLANPIQYGYDAAGRRTKQSVGASVTNYLWDETSPYRDVVRETDGSGTQQASYVLGNSELLSQNRGGTTSYYLYDGQGSVRALADGSSGNLTDRYSYSAFGQNQSRIGTTVNPYQYAGQQFDALSGLYDMRARYYSPNDGHFLSMDTASFDYANPNELNRYNYTHSDPIDNRDPSGYSVAGVSASPTQKTSAGDEYASLINIVSLVIATVIAVGLAVSCDDQYIERGCLCT